MLVVRYVDNDGVNDINVSMQNAYYVYQNAKRMYGHADLLWIEADGRELCLM